MVSTQTTADCLLVKRIPDALLRAVSQGLTLRDYAVLVALVTNKAPMTRQQLEEATGLEDSAVLRSTVRLRELDLVKTDKTLVVGGNKGRAAKFSIK
jgi:predicted transcriptional regulator